jgi:ankyrin repeat protein
VPIAVTAVAAVFVTGRVMLDQLSRATAYDVCERSDLDLVRAAGAGDADTVRDELEERDPDEHDQYGNTALGCAIPRHRTQVIEPLLAAGADPGERSGAGDYAELPIELAYEQGDRPTLTALLDRGANPNEHSEHSTPLLLLAIRSGDDHLVVELLDHGADPTEQAAQAPLALAAESGTDATVEVLLDRGAAPDGLPGSRPVVGAARAGRGAVVDRLLAAGADLTVAEGPAAPASVGAVALTEAASGGHVAPVSSLLALGVDPDEIADNGPLLRAVASGHREVAAALLDAGADPDAGATSATLFAFSLAAIDPDLSRRVLGTGPVPGLPSTAPGSAVPAVDLGPTVPVPPLTAAAARQDPQLVELLLVHGADPNRSTLDGWSPLVIAGVTCDVPTAQLLVGAGVDPSATLTAPPERAPCEPVRALLAA